MSEGSLQIGIRLPVYSSGDLVMSGGARGLADYCRRVEQSGFDSIWVIDHLLVAPALYATSWPDPLEVLTVAATVTDECKLGTNILVVPLWHPVLLAKRIATLSALSGGRFILGVGAGWEEAEFASLGIPRSERGRRTDEVLAAMKRLWTERGVTFEGEFFSFNDVTLEPRLDARPEIWVAGGSVTQAPKAGDAPTLTRSVRDRIINHEGWLCRSGGSDAAGVARDWEEIKAACATEGQSLPVFGHAQWIHVVDSADEATVLDEQLQAFRRVMGQTRTVENLRESYLIGTIDQILERIGRLRSIGLEYLTLNPVLPDPEQLDLIKKHLLES